MSSTMQALQKQMRTDRDNEAAIMFGRMNCPYSQYPIALAFSDLEDYARSGTLSSALLGLNKTTTQAQTQAQTAKSTAAATAAGITAGGKAGRMKAALAPAVAGVGGMAGTQTAAANALPQQLANAANTIQTAAKCPIIPPS
jgi:hypothetical protein